MSQTTLLQLIDVGMEFRAPSGEHPLRVLDGVNLTVDEGQFVCVAGRSGSGKTTLVMIAAGLLPPTHGSVDWSGTSLATLSDAEVTRRRAEHVGVVFQNSGLIDALTAAENVALPGMPRGSGGPERAHHLLARVGLDDRADHFPWQLSGGEQQRVAIARALFAEPPLLLVDEPTANLDHHGAQAMIDLLVALKTDERGVLVASHDLALIKRADVVYHLE